MPAEYRTDCRPRQFVMTPRIAGLRPSALSAAGEYWIRFLIGVPISNQGARFKRISRSLNLGSERSGSNLGSTFR